MVTLRGIDPATLTALQSAFYPVVIVFVDWPSGPVRVHSGVGTMNWAGHDWHGVGDVGGVMLPGEDAGMAQGAASVSIGGDPVDLSDIMREDYLGREVSVWYGIVTERAGASLVGQPFDVFTGEIETAVDEQTPGFRGITLEITTGPSQRSAGRAVHSYADQIAEFPGDTAGRWANAARARLGSALPRW